MPVERRSGTKQVTSIVFGIVAVLIAVGIAWGLLALASGGTGPVRIQLGDDEFDAGQAVRLSRQIRQDGPTLFSDVSGRGQLQPIVVNHFGDDPRSAGSPRGARARRVLPDLELRRGGVRERRPPRAGQGRSREICSNVTYPPNGEGLEQYGWQVDDEGNLIIDVRGDDGTTTTGG
jgi:hypothetical protein